MERPTARASVWANLAPKFYAAGELPVRCHHAWWDRGHGCGHGYGRGHGCGHGDEGSRHR
jgi:hypothetical protein